MDPLFINEYIPPWKEEDWAVVDRAEASPPWPLRPTALKSGTPHGPNCRPGLNRSAPRFCPGCRRAGRCSKGRAWRARLWSCHWLATGSRRLCRTGCGRRRWCTRGRLAIWGMWCWRRGRRVRERASGSGCCPMRFLGRIARGQSVWERCRKIGGRGSLFRLGLTAPKSFDWKFSSGIEFRKKFGRWLCFSDESKILWQSEMRNAF